MNRPQTTIRHRVPPGPRLRLLVVEPVERAGHPPWIGRLLDEAGVDRFAVERAGGVVEARRLLAQRTYDLVLLDLDVGGQGAMGVDRLRDALGRAPLIVFSGEDDDALSVAAIKAGAQDVLVKGQVDARSLARAIAYAVERQRMLLDLEQARQREHFLATHDSLTGLSNRPQFQRALTDALSYARRYDESVAVLFLDLDLFKSVNDTLGHVAGDALLCAAAERLVQCVRESDSVARLGGDEFTVLVRHLPRPSAAGRIAETIAHRLSRPYVIDGHEVTISASVGVAVHPDDGSCATSLLKSADAAMYRAKEGGRNKIEFYREGLSAPALRRHAIEKRLRASLKREEFVLHYQPQVDVALGRVTGAEALLRWRHPELGLVRPAEFIPVAEETGLIDPIGEWVLREACLQQTAWCRDGLDRLRIAVNVSASQLRDPDLPRRVAAIFEATGAEPRRMEIEITESAIMRDTSRSVASLRALKELGLHVSIDDFGTGHSSLSNLKRLPVDTLKIDRSFVADLTRDPNDAAITSAIIAMARSLRLDTVAEGVEERSQVDYLRTRRCHRMQGYFFSPPVPASDFACIVRNQLPGIAGLSQPVTPTLATPALAGLPTA